MAGSAGTVQGTPLPGATLTATLPGFAADADVAVTLHSDPIALGTVKASSAGVATTTFTVPLDFTGSHTVEGIGNGPAGTPVTVTAAFVVTTNAAVPAGGTAGTSSSSAGGALAFTGVNSRDLASIAILMMAVGLLLLDFQLRRAQA